MAHTTDTSDPEPPSAQMADARGEVLSGRFTVPARDGAAAVAARDRVAVLALVAADIIALVVTLAVAPSLGARPTAGALILLVLAPLLVSGAGLYERDELLLRKTTLEEAPRIAAVAGLTVLIAFLTGPFTFDKTLGGGEGLFLWSALAVLMIGGRSAVRALVERQSPPERCLLIGGGGDEARLRRALGDSVSTTIAGRAPLSRFMQETEHGVYEVNLRALAGLVRWFDAQRIIISAEQNSTTATLELLRASKAVGVRLSFLSATLGAIGHGLVIDDVYGIPLVGVRRFRLRRRQQLIKRSFDIIVGSALLLALLPLSLVVAIAIRLGSPGPTLFRQRRIGRDGNSFEILKFRTMVADAEQRKDGLRENNEADGLFKIAEDPRITKVGRWLRRTSLDELPQLLNVLRGDMSLVGPRPLVPDEDQQVRGYDRRRLHLTPGMTGQWQILGSARVPMEEMLRIDYRYVTGWTLWEDVKILLRTFPYVLARRGQ